MKRPAEAVTDGQGNGEDGIHPSRKRRIEYTETDAKLASLYSNLSDEVKSVRLHAAAELVRILKTSDASVYDRALTRLIRGLCSSRKASRSGFFVALTEVFRLQPNVQADLSLAAIVSKTESLTLPDHKSSGQERRDHLLGRCVAFKALIQSKILFQPKVPKADWETFLDHIFQLSSENAWLRKECGLVLHESLSVLSQLKDLDLQYVSALVSKMHATNHCKTPEGLAVWLTVSTLYPACKLPKGVWHHNDPLCSKERPVVAKILRDNTNGEPKEDSAATNAKSSSPQTSPSFAWQVVLQHLYDRVEKTDKTSDFAKFWVEAVDNGLFPATASVERKALGLQVATMAVTTTPGALLSHIFTPNLMRCIINQRVEKDRYLHESAKVPLTCLVARGKAEPPVIPDLFEALTSANGSISFDKLTKTKTIDDLLTHTNIEAAEKVLATIHNLIRTPRTEDHGQANLDRTTLANMLLTFTRKQQPKPADSREDSDLFWEVLNSTLVEYGYLGPSRSAGNAPNPPLSKESQEVFRNRLMSCLHHVLSAKLDESFTIPFDVALSVEIKSKDLDAPLLLDADTTVLAALSESVSTMQDIAKKSIKNKPLRALILLYALCILQVYNGDADAVSVLDDLKLCWASLRKSDDASSIIIEVLLSFISKPSALFRKLAEQVFGAFASQITEDGLMSMLDILEKKENLAGQQELFDQADDADDGAEEDEEEEEDVSIDGEDASDVEMVDESVDEEDDGSEDSENVDEEDVEKDTDSSDEEDEEAADEETSAFESKLALALGTSKRTGDNESDSDDSDMDDEQMMALDGHLTTIFKERSKQSGKKKDSKDAKENIINFKNRVLDLLLIYVKQEHANFLSLSLILPIITLIRTTTSKQISEKAFNLLKQLSDSCNKTKKFPEPAAVKDGVHILHAIHDEMRKNASKLHSNACSRASLFVAKVMITADVDSYDDVADSYAELQKEWYKDPKSHVQASVFTEWTSWCIATRKH